MIRFSEFSAVRIFYTYLANRTDRINDLAIEKVNRPYIFSLKVINVSVSIILSNFKKIIGKNEVSFLFTPTTAQTGLLWPAMVVNNY